VCSKLSSALLFDLLRLRHTQRHSRHGPLFVCVCVCVCVCVYACVCERGSAKPRERENECACVCVCERERERERVCVREREYVCNYGVASVSRIDKIIGLFCKRAP